MRAIAIAAAVLLGACAPATEPGTDGLAGGTKDGNEVRVLGAIKGYNLDDPRIQIAVSGRTATVKITTYGGGCHRKGETEVSVSGLTANIAPYDYTAPPGTVCTQPLLSFHHEATLQFDRAGTAVIRVRGMDARAGSPQNPDGTEIIVERSIQIQ